MRSTLRRNLDLSTPSLLVFAFSYHPFTASLSIYPIVNHASPHNFRRCVSSFDFRLSRYPDIFQNAKYPESDTFKPSR
jgi:hypothetical protein